MQAANSAEASADPGCRRVGADLRVRPAGADTSVGPYSESMSTARKYRSQSQGNRPYFFMTPSIRSTGSA